MKNQLKTTKQQTVSNSDQTSQPAYMHLVQELSEAELLGVSGGRIKIETAFTCVVVDCC